MCFLPTAGWISYSQLSLRSLIWLYPPWRFPLYCLPLYTLALFLLRRYCRLISLDLVVSSLVTLFPTRHPSPFLPITSTLPPGAEAAPSVSRARPRFVAHRIGRRLSGVCKMGGWRCVRVRAEGKSVHGGRADFWWGRFLWGHFFFLRSQPSSCSLPPPAPCRICACSFKCCFIS